MPSDIEFDVLVSAKGGSIKLKERNGSAAGTEEQGKKSKKLRAEAEKVKPPPATTEEPTDSAAPRKRRAEAAEEEVQPPPAATEQPADSTPRKRRKRSKKAAEKADEPLTKQQWLQLVAWKQQGHPLSELQSRKLSEATEAAAAAKKKSKPHPIRNTRTGW